MSNRYCSQDNFAIALNEILQEVVSDVDSTCYPAVRKTCKYARDKVVENAEGYGWDSYPKGFKYTTSRRRLESIGEVGNETKPGLVHLLEKGHAKMGGGRVAARPHVAPAAEEAFDYFWNQIDEAVRRAL